MTMDTNRPITIDHAQPQALRTPFHALRWSARELADAVPPRLHAPRLHTLFADGLPPAANDTPPPPPPRRWQQGYLRRGELPALLRIHN
jgi:hypothetical protein